LRNGEYTFVDRAFDNEINRLLAEAETAFKRMSFREALKNVWFEMLNMKEQYRVLTEGGKMHASLVEKFSESIAIAMSPITPHFCEHIWSDVLGKDGLVMDAKWPQLSVDLGLSRKYQALQANLREFRLDYMRATGAKKAGKGGNAPIENPTDAFIFCAEGYAPYQRAALIALSQVELDLENEPVDKKYMATVKDHPEMLALSKTDLQKALKFAPFHMANDVKANGKQALELSLPYNEIEMLSEQVALIAKQLGLSGSVQVMSASTECALDTLKPSKREQATPGKATILFYKQ
jgi:leucyl-tRNA synthetase